ncbi:MAG TPA: amidase [Dehalococcoidia bacterium]|nr:amidase [Dehalococcoidia bacterium]
MQATDLSGLTIARAAELIRSREVSPVDLADEYLARIGRLNPAVNAYVAVTAERARADARRAAEEIAAGNYRGPLHGVPIALKDLYDTAGIETAGGAKFLRGRVPAQDSTPARKLREAGSVLLGKLNTHELAYGVTTNNPHFGATHNPWKLDHIPGGSSGGSGAAIAAGMAVATLGTDTGGSIRIPASLCGCVGLKPTYGRASKAGVLPLSYLLDHPGPIVQSVEDAAIVLGAIAGYDPDDPATVPVPVIDYTAELRAGVGGLRVGVLRSYFFERLDDEVRAAVEAAIATLRGLGAEPRDVEIPGIQEAVASLFGIVLVEAQAIHAEPLASRPADFGPDVGAILSQPTPPTAAVAAALRAKDVLSVAMRRELETVDLLLTPTTPLPAIPIGQETVKYGGVEEPAIAAFVRCTGPFNASGLPALSLPCGFTRAGLPIGLQLAGRPFDEATVLRAGHAYEQATEWHRRRPAIGVGG